MKVGKLAALIEQQAEMSSLLGASKHDIERLTVFSKFLDGYSDLTIEDFISFYEVAPKKVAGGSARAPRPVASAEVVKSYIERFQSADDNSQLIFDQLKVDQELRLAELKLIATALEGANLNYKSKPKVIAAIGAWLQRQADKKRRLQEASGIF